MNRTIIGILGFVVGVLAAVLVLVIPPGKVDILNTATVNILLSADGKSCTLDTMPVNLDKTKNVVQWVPPAGYNVFSVEFPNQPLSYGTPFFDPRNGVWIRYFDQTNATTPPGQAHPLKNNYPIQKVTLTNAAGALTVCYDQTVAPLDPMRVIITQ